MFYVVWNLGSMNENSMYYIRHVATVMWPTSVSILSCGFMTISKHASNAHSRISAKVEGHPDNFRLLFFEYTTKYSDILLFWHTVLFAKYSNSGFVLIPPCYAIIHFIYCHCQNWLKGQRTTSCTEDINLTEGCVCVCVLLSLLSGEIKAFLWV